MEPTTTLPSRVQMVGSTNFRLTAYCYSLFIMSTDRGMINSSSVNGFPRGEESFPNGSGIMVSSPAGQSTGCFRMLCACCGLVLQLMMQVMVCERDYWCIRPELLGYTGIAAGILACQT